MSTDREAERPLGIYLVALYFVLAGFLEAIQKYREWNTSVSLNPFGEHSIWVLAIDPIIYMSIAFLIWHYAALGRLAALVFGYVILAMYLGIAVSYYASDTSLNVTPLFLAIACYHVVSLVPMLWYLQPARRKQLFHVTLWDILLGSD